MVASDEPTAIRKEKEKSDGRRVKRKGVRGLSRDRRKSGDIV